MTIDVTKRYKTKSGLRVVNLSFKPFNDAGRPVTFPIKGSIVLSEKPLRLTYEIWTAEGKIDVVNNKRNHLDLIEE